MEEQGVAEEHTDNTATHGIRENVVAHIDNDNADTDPDWSANGPTASAKPAGRPPKRGRGRPRIHQRGGNTNRGRTIRTQPQAQTETQKEPEVHDQPSGEKRTVTLFFEPRKTRLTAHKEDMMLQEAIRTSTEPDSRHGSRALSPGGEQDTIYMKTASDLPASTAGPGKSSHDYAVKPVQNRETSRKLPEREFDGEMEQRGRGTNKSLSNGSQDHVQSFIQAPDALVYPDAYSESEQQTALRRYGDDIVSRFRVKWKETLKSTPTDSQDSQNSRRSVDVWKSLLDPDLAPRFPGKLSARYREYTEQCKRKMEQGTPRRNLPGQPRAQQREGQEQKQSRKRQREEAEPPKVDDSPVAPQAKRRKLPTSPQPKQPVQPEKRHHEDVESEDDDEPLAKRRKLVTFTRPKQPEQPKEPEKRPSRQAESEAIYGKPIFPNPRPLHHQSGSLPNNSPTPGNTGPSPRKNSAWRVISQPNARSTNSLTEPSSSKKTETAGTGERESPSKKFSFSMMQKEPSNAKMQAQAQTQAQTPTRKKNNNNNNINNFTGAPLTGKR